MCSNYFNNRKRVAFVGASRFDLSLGIFRLDLW
jgi:hypothetical protein